MSNRKPHSLQRRYHRQAQYAVKGIGAAFITGRTHVECVNLKSGNIIKPSMVLARAISEVPYQWTVLMSVMGRDWQGKPYYKDEMIQMAVRYKQSSLVEYLNEQHQSLIKGFNKNDMVAAGWIAIPDKAEISPGLADKIYTNMGVWDE